MGLRTNEAVQVKEISDLILILNLFILDVKLDQLMLYFIILAYQIW